MRSRRLIRTSVDAVKKTKAEVEKQKAEHAAKERLRKQRREEQEAEDHNTKSEDEEPSASREGGAEKIPESGDGLEDSGPDEHRPRVI